MRLAAPILLAALLLLAASAGAADPTPQISTDDYFPAPGQKVTVFVDAPAGYEFAVRISSRGSALRIPTETLNYTTSAGAPWTVEYTYPGEGAYLFELLHPGVSNGTVFDQTVDSFAVWAAEDPADLATGIINFVRTRTAETVAAFVASVGETLVWGLGLLGFALFLHIMRHRKEIAEAVRPPSRKFEEDLKKVLK